MNIKILLQIQLDTPSSLDERQLITALEIAGLQVAHKYAPALRTHVTATPEECDHDFQSAGVVAGPAPLFGAN